jgi:hypothetical protein
MFYFEDIFNTIIVLWKETYLFSKDKDTENMIFSISEDFRALDWHYMEENKKKYNDWERVMVFIIYQVITDFALNLDKTERYFNLKDIPMDLFEKQWIYNFYKLQTMGEAEEYEEFKANYKGFKTLMLSGVTLGEYLKYHSLSLQ